MIAQNDKGYYVLGDKYKKRRKLQQTAINTGEGQVFLVQDKYGQQYCYKYLSKIKYAQQSNKIMWKRQIQVQKKVKSQYFKKIIEEGQFQDYVYIIEQYFGDLLLTYQAKLPNKIFTLKQAVSIILEVVQALKELHRFGYIHGDLKSPSILIKKQNGKLQIRLTNLSFCKNQGQQLIQQGIIGTQTYMAPEHYKNYEKVGFQIDIWALGVMFYFMLTMTFPFFQKQTILNLQVQQKYQYLTKEGQNFSYKKSVQNSKKKIVQNCIPDVEKLFTKFFNPNPKQRINISQLQNRLLLISYSHHLNNNQDLQKYITQIQQLQKQRDILLKQNKQLKQQMVKFKQDGKKVKDLSNQIKQLLSDD